MRLTLVEANNLNHIRAGETRFTTDNSTGKAVILKMFEGKPSIKLNLYTKSADRITKLNASNTKRYVGVAPLEVDFYNFNWNDNVHLTAIYAYHQKEPHSRIYIFATPHKVDAVQLARDLLKKIAKDEPLDTEYPMLEIKQPLNRRLNVALPELTSA